MTKEEILSFIAASTSIEELEIIRRAAWNRKKTLQEEAIQRRAAAVWDRIKCHKPGDVLYCCAEIFAGPLKRGDKVKVYIVQPRKKRLWVIIKGRGKPVYFTPLGVDRYNLSQFPPEGR